MKKNISCSVLFVLFCQLRYGKVRKDCNPGSFLLPFSPLFYSSNFIHFSTIDMLGSGGMQVGEFFDAYLTQGRYQPNAYLQHRYPDDWP